MTKNNSIIRHAKIKGAFTLLPLISEIGYPATLKDSNRRFLKSKEMGCGVEACKINDDITGPFCLDKNRSFDLGCNTSQSLYRKAILVGVSVNEIC